MNYIQQKQKGLKIECFLNGFFLALLIWVSVELVVEVAKHL